jgi:hypothetical protein
MDVTHSNATGRAAIVPHPESKIPGQLAGEVRGSVQIDLGAAAGSITPADLDSAQQRLGYGLPCVKCHLYYPANLDACPWCHAKERVSAAVTVTRKAPVGAAESSLDDAALEQEREAFLQQFKSQFDSIDDELTKAPVICTFSRQHPEGSEPASICKPCYERLQQRVDVLEAALHIDLKEAAQIVYQAVWADPSDPAKTYANAAAALLTELRKRAGVSSVLGPFQRRGN